MKTKLINIAKIVITTGALLGFVGVASALGTWTAPPSGTAPTCPSGYAGCDAPVNISASTQSKPGTLGLQGLLNIGSTVLNGTLKITGIGTPTAGRILQSDPSGTGNVIWAAPPAAFTGVVTDATLTGAGTSPSPLHVVGGGSGTVSGTTNYIAKFTSATAVGNSAMYESGGNIGIGTTTPGELVQAYSNPNNALLAVQSGTNSIWGVQANHASNTLSIGPLSSSHAVSPQMTVSGSGVDVPGALTNAGHNVCRQDGVNCPAPAAGIPIYMAAHNPAGGSWGSLECDYFSDNATTDIPYYHFGTHDVDWSYTLTSHPYCRAEYTTSYWPNTLVGHLIP